MLLALAFGLAACSSDEPNPLGRELADDVLGSRPGVVFQDTIDVLADTVLTYYTLISASDRLALGRENGYEYAMILRPSVANAGDDTLRTVQEANLVLTMYDGYELKQLPARFYTLATPYEEGDAVSALNLDRFIGSDTLTFADRRYALPPALVQGWIRGDSANNGMAIVYDAGFDDFAEFHSRSAEDTAYLDVFFDDQEGRAYDIAHDATYIRPTTTTSNLIISDGFVRRTYFRADIGALPDSAAVHKARVRFHVVPNTVRVAGQDPLVILYAPMSDDPTSPDFLKEEIPHTSVSVTDTSSVIELTVTFPLLLTLEGQIQDNGFVLHFVSENTGLRQAEFYGSQAADSLRPRVFVTASTPAEFDR